MTFRWRLLPPVFEVHSKPMKAVNRPGSFASSAALIVSRQALRYADEPGKYMQFLREGTLGKRHDNFNGRFRALARLNHVVPPAPRRIAEYFRLAREEIREKSHLVGMIGDRHEIERTRELRALAAGGDNLLSLAEPIGIGRTDAGAERAGIHRERRVQCACRRKTAGSENRVPRTASTAICWGRL